MHCLVPHTIPITGPQAISIGDCRTKGDSYYVTFALRQFEAYVVSCRGQVASEVRARTFKPRLMIFLTYLQISTLHGLGLGEDKQGSYIGKWVFSRICICGLAWSE